MIRCREFAISTASLAGLSLAAGCSPIGNLEGDWDGVSMVRGSQAFELPLSFEGVIESAGWFGSSVTDFSTYTMDMSLSVDKDDDATFTLSSHKVYNYVYDYGSGYDPYVADVDFTSELTYSGPITRLSDRRFDIVMGLDSNDVELIVNAVTQEPAEEVPSPSTPTTVFDCSTDGDQLHCFQGSNLLIFEQE